MTGGALDTESTGKAAPTKLGHAFMRRDEEVDLVSVVRDASGTATASHNAMGVNVLCHSDP